jgi:hypothetical protein
MGCGCGKKNSGTPLQKFAYLTPAQLRMLNKIPPADAHESVHEDSAELGGEEPPQE